MENHPTGVKRQERIAAYIVKTLAAAPPLTEQQRTKLAELLRPVRLEIAAERQAQARVAELDDPADLQEVA